MSRFYVRVLDPKTGRVLDETRDVPESKLAGAAALANLNYPDAQVEVDEDFLEIPEFLRRKI